MARKPNRGVLNQQLARAGEHFVAAELNRRGAFAVTLAGNMPDIDVIATNASRDRTIYIQVKTKQRGTWHTTKDRGVKTQPKDVKLEDSFWILVHLDPTSSTPKYWIVPDYWMRNRIYERVQEYRTKHKDKLLGHPEPPHCGIHEKWVTKWEGKWHILSLW